MDYKQFFERVYCVNLERRPDRWRKFEAQVPKDWPFAFIRRVRAVDGQKTGAPDWWKQGPGAWGCYRTHLRLIEQCLNDGVKSVLLLEDDAEFVPGFVDQAKAYLEQVPKDWGMLYLGGQHLDAAVKGPQRVSDLVYRPHNVNRTHAWALRGECMQRIYRHLQRLDWHHRHHIDHHLGRYHQAASDVYCPKTWLINQAAGKSNISGKRNPEGWGNFEGAGSLEESDPNEALFVAVLGLHSSGSSCMAGVLHHLGLHLGNNLIGYYGNDPNKSCGFEAEGLAKLCEDSAPFPSTEFKNRRGQRWHKLRLWINQRRREANKMGTIAAGKYPILCRFGPQLHNICGDKLRILSIDRPVDESIASLVKRCPGKDPGKIADHQRWLERGKWEAINQPPSSVSIPNQVLHINYADLLADPKAQVDRVVEWLDIKPTSEQVERACRYPDPSKRHIGGEAPAVSA